MQEDNDEGHLLHILRRLPVKSLLRFRCVCRRWNRLISSHSFAHEHAAILRPVSGLFYHTTADLPEYAPFCRATDSLPDLPLSFLPEAVTVKASARGLLCCRGHHSQEYYVCNPATAVWIRLPTQPTPHGPDSSVVLLFDDSTCKSNSPVDFWVVCAYPVIKDLHFFGLDTFSTAAWGWATSSWIVDKGQLVPRSGVAASGIAWWRTTKQTLMGYRPLVDALWCVDRFGVDVVWWELGEMEGKFCVTDVRAASTFQESARARVQVWETPLAWTVRGLFDFWPGLCENKLRPLRMHGVGEVMLWDGYRQVFGHDMEGRTTRLLVVDAPDCRGEFLPYVSTLMKVKR